MLKLLFNFQHYNWNKEKRQLNIYQKRLDSSSIPQNLSQNRAKIMRQNNKLKI